MGEDHEGRLGTGVPELDDVLGGGLCEGDSALAIGPPGSGKATFAFQRPSESRVKCVEHDEEEGVS